MEQQNGGMVKVANAHFMSAAIKRASAALMSARACQKEHACKIIKKGHFRQFGYNPGPKLYIILGGTHPSSLKDGRPQVARTRPPTRTAGRRWHAPVLLEGRQALRPRVASNDVEQRHQRLPSVGGRNGQT